MSKKSILIVDDEPEIREILGEVLSAKYHIFFAENGVDAIKIAQKEKPTLIILDFLMPGKNGVETCKDLREHSQTKSIPVIMLTAMDDYQKKTAAFDSGADDYITKPFNFEELQARVQSKIRRLEEAQSLSSHILNYGDLTLNFQDFKADVGGKNIEIGQIEFKILNFLIKNQGELVKREVLNDFVWGDDLPAERALDPHINALRGKLKDSRLELKTIYGQGYSLALKE